MCRLLQLSNPANIPPKLDPGTLTLNALYTFAACAAGLTHAARSAACRRLCRFLAALPADVQSFTDSEALSVLGALSRAAQDTGAACVADVLAAVLERCPRVEAAAAAAAPARNRVHSASSVAQLMLNLQVRSFLTRDDDLHAHGDLCQPHGHAKLQEHFSC